MCAAPQELSVGQAADGIRGTVEAPERARQAGGVRRGASGGARQAGRVGEARQGEERSSR